MELELLGLGFAVSKTIENGNGIYIFIRYNGISNNWDWDFEKNSAGKCDRETPLPRHFRALKYLRRSYPPPPHFRALKYLRPS